MTAAAAVNLTGRRSVPREWLGSVATILVKELRSRMRGRRAFVVLTLYLGLLALIAWAVYAVVGPEARRSALGMGGLEVANASALIGQMIFTALSVFQIILVCFIAPAFTAGQVSLEREKQTLDLLISTPLRPSAIVVGKLLAALAFVMLMIVAAVPISALVAIYARENGVGMVFGHEPVMPVPAGTEPQGRKAVNSRPAADIEEALARQIRATKQAQQAALGLHNLSLTHTAGVARPVFAKCEMVACSEILIQGAFRRSSQRTTSSALRTVSICMNNCSHKASTRSIE